MRPKPPTAVPLEVKTFEVLTVTELDECRQRFRAVVLLQLLTVFIAGGRVTAFVH